MNRFKPYLTRIGFTIFICFLFISNIREISFYISSIDFGYGSIRQDISFVAALFITLPLIWIFLGFITQIASSLGFTKPSEREFVITGNANTIFLNKEAMEASGKKNTITGLGFQKYESSAPLIPLEQARTRLIEHISGLRNSSIFNLFIGIAITIIGIATIGTTFFEVEKYANAEKGFDAYGFILFVLLPRLSIALIVQVFSFFFLLMYRSNVQDVKYFQNEITNIDVHASAINLLKSSGDISTKSTIAILLKTERNRVIGKNQKTIGSNNDDDIMGKLVAIENKISESVRLNQMKTSG